MAALQILLRGRKDKIFLLIFMLGLFVITQLMPKNNIIVKKKILEKDIQKDMSYFLKYHPNTHDFPSLFNISQGNFHHTCYYSSKPKFFVFIHSHPSQLIRRLRIRNSWGSFRLKKWTDAAIFFIIGAHSSKDDHQKIITEGFLFKDILIGEFPENEKYHDIKAITWIHWTYTRCNNIPYLVKTHDEMFLDLIKLNEITKNKPLQDNHVALIKKHGKVTLIFNRETRNWLAKDFKNRWPWPKNSIYFSSDSKTKLVDWSFDFNSEPLSWNSFKKTYSHLLTLEAIEPAFKSGFKTTSFENFLLKPKKSCKSDLKTIYVVHTAVTHDYLRRVIRETWGNKKVCSYLNIKVIFFVGRHADHIVERQILKEQEIHDDLVVGDYIDHYQNLTFKALSWMKYIEVNCPNVQNIIKVDDDVFVDVFKAKHYVETDINFKKQKHSKFFCSYSSGSGVIRQKNHKSFISYEEYPLKNYPSYCSGLFFILSKTVSDKLLGDFRKNTSYIWVDDAFITGILAARINVTHHQMSYNTEFNARRLMKWDKLIFRLVEGSDNNIYRFVFWKHILIMHNALQFLEDKFKSLPTLPNNFTKKTQFLDLPNDFTLPNKPYS